jgi:hypothetical protein
MGDASQLPGSVRRQSNGRFVLRHPHVGAGDIGVGTLSEKRQGEKEPRNMTWLLVLWGKTKFYALAAVAAITALWAGYRHIRADGAAAERAKQAEQQRKLQEKYDEVDRQPIDPADSYERLRGLRDRSR